jgi:uncharacterized protein YwgA
MPVLKSKKTDAEKAADIIRDAGGRVVGRTRLQKMAYLLEITGLGSGFSFEYRHYGPFSDELANAVVDAQLWDLITEEEHTANWGGSYSIYTAETSAPKADVKPARKQILELGIKTNPISLELAATAAFLANEGNSDPWDETVRRKPEKAAKWLKEAKDLYAKLQSIQVPTPLPSI